MAACLKLLSLLLLLSLSSLALSTTVKPEPRIQGSDLLNLLRMHYGSDSGSYIAFNLRLFFQNREDLLRQQIEQMKREGRLSYLCRYVTQEACHRQVSSQNSMFLYIVQTLNVECCTSVNPVHGMWGQWGTWSTCSVTCGQGVRSRSRRCDSPSPSGGGQNCQGYGVEHQQCYQGTCPSVPTMINGMWGQWGSWSTCSVTCGQGTRSRSRRCDSPSPSGGGLYCQGYAMEQEQCYQGNCPTVPIVVNGMWGQWEGWMACSVSCGQGSRSRSRRCDSPSPSGGGQFCSGNSVEWQQCHLGTCPSGARTCSHTQFQMGGRVMGGSAAIPGQYPWLVHLVIGGTIRCAAVIVDTMHVLTAGHCLARRVENNLLTTHDLEIVAGNFKRSLVLEPNAQRISVVKGMRHFNYDPTYLKNDVAVLRLAQPLRFNSVVSNICLPAKTDTLPQTCVVAGWGALNYSYNFPEQLQDVDLTVYDSDACKRAFDSSTSYNISTFLMPGVMCAANGLAGGKDSCRGDSGSGLMCYANDAQGPYYKLFGLVSSGFGCGGAGQPGYYTYLPFYMDWIQQAIQLTGP